VVEVAWEQISAAAGLLDEWRTTLTRAVAAVAHYIEQHSRTTLEDRLAGRLEWPPIPDSTDAREGAGDPQVIRAVDGGYLDQRIQETLLAGDPMVAGADARQHAVYLVTQLVTRHCGPVPTPRTASLTASQREAVRLVEEQDREYEEAVRVDTGAQRHASVVGGGSDSPQVAEPDASEMRRVRLQRFGLGD